MRHSRGHRDHQRADAHQRDRQRQARLAPVAIGIDAHEPGADRTHDEAHGEHWPPRSTVERWVVGGKEGRREIERESRIGVPVVPLDQIAGRAADDRLDATTTVQSISQDFISLAVGRSSMSRAAATRPSRRLPPCPVQTDGARVSTIRPRRQSRSRARTAGLLAKMLAFDPKVRRTWTAKPNLASNPAFDVDVARSTGCSAYGTALRRLLSGGTTSWTV
jgi:hypothetical protein